MSRFVDVELTDNVRLPYSAGAENALAGIDPALAAAWEAMAAAFPGLMLNPLFDEVPAEEIQAMAAAARERSGEEPPDLLAWYAIQVDDELADVVAAAVAALPFVATASPRPEVAPCAVPRWGTSTQGPRELQVLPPPRGVDALWAWHVRGGTAPGVRICDVENGWDLAHEDLRNSRITPVSIFGSLPEHNSHGTAVAGVVVGADDGVGIVGIAPAAELLLVSDNRGAGSNTAMAVLAAARAVGVDGIVLIEVADTFGRNKATVPVEFDPAVQRVIRFVGLFGITVIEPAGNGAVDLDSHPEFAHFNPQSPTFVDSRAVMVGAGEPGDPDNDIWVRASFSSFGARVDCFGPGQFVRAPTQSPDTYADFNGTSSASAVIAGVAAVIQGMSVADSGRALDVEELRRVLSDPDLGTAIPEGQQAGIGSMPDLRKIALARGWPRIVPAAIVATGSDSLSAAFLDTENRLVRRQWQFFSGWSDLDPTPAANVPNHVLTGRPMLTVRQERDPIVRLVIDAFLVGVAGIQHIWWDDQGQLGSLKPIAAPDHAAMGVVPAVAATDEKQVAVASVTPDGELWTMVGDAGLHFPGGLGTGQPIDQGNAYRRLRNPAICSRAAGTADILAIDDGGTLRWFSGVTNATIGTGWQPGIADTSGASFDGGAGVTAIVVGPENARTLVALAVGLDGHLRAIDIDPAQNAITSVFLVGTADITAEAPVALGIAGDNVVALAVNSAGTLLAATRAVTGGPWSDQVQVNPDTAVMSSGGVVAASLQVGIVALVVDIKGTVMATQSRNGVDWVAYDDVSE